MTQPRFTFPNRLAMFDKPASQTLPVPEFVRAALFDRQPSAGFVAVPGTMANGPQAGALPLYQWAQETARAQVAQRRADRCVPCAN